VYGKCDTIKYIHMYILKITPKLNHIAKGEIKLSIVKCRNG